MCPLALDKLKFLQANLKYLSTCPTDKSEILNTLQPVQGWQKTRTAYPPSLLQGSSNYAEKPVQNGMETKTPGRSGRGRHLAARESPASSHLSTENRTMSAPFPPLQTETVSYWWLSMWHRSTNTRTCAAGFTYLQRSDMWSLALCSGAQREALWTCRCAQDDSGLCTADQTENLVWPGNSKRRRRKPKLLMTLNHLLYSLIFKASLTSWNLGIQVNYYLHLSGGQVLYFGLAITGNMSSNKMPEYLISSVFLLLVIKHRSLGLLFA